MEYQSSGIYWQQESTLCIGRDAKIAKRTAYNKMNKKTQRGTPRKTITSEGNRVSGGKGRFFFCVQTKVSCSSVEQVGVGGWGNQTPGSETEGCAIIVHSIQLQNFCYISIACTSQRKVQYRITSTNISFFFLFLFSYTYVTTNQSCLLQVQA